MQCQKCKTDFPIEPEDHVFYKKMAVPPPTLCPRCRFQRRTMFRNERVLYRRKCDLCQKDIISIYSPASPDASRGGPDKPFTVYCGPCWWSDNWDPLASGRPYDPTRPFFTQVQELMRAQPQVALVVDFPNLQNSDYTNHTGHIKNCYLIFDADYCENVHYSTTMNTTKDTMDCHLVWESELCYEDVNNTRTFRAFYSEDCTDSSDVWFSKNLTDCQNCFGCINLKSKKYHIFNEPHSKEDYEAKIREFDLDSWQGVQDALAKTKAFHLTQPHKYMRERHNENVSGDYIYESKNAHHVFSVRGVEDSKYCVRLNVKPIKDAYDYFEWGHNAQRIYECITVGEETSDMRFTFFGLKSMDAEYCMSVISCAHLFGCVGLRNKKYCILNKQYAPEEFAKLRNQIIADMGSAYGEFFPHELSPFGYNETTAMQYLPLTKEQALAQGFAWKEPEPNPNKITMASDKIPDKLGNVQDSITKEVLGCATCSKPYRVISQELALLRKFGLPVPRSCPDCRAQARMSRLAPPFLHDRSCAKCRAPLQTSYSQDRKEIVYCEPCYQAEVV